MPVAPKLRKKLVSTTFTVNVVEKAVAPVYGGSLERMSHSEGRTQAYRPQRSWKAHRRDQHGSVRA
jgi:hypothetical protein